MKKEPKYKENGREGGKGGGGERVSKQGVGFTLVQKSKK